MNQREIKFRAWDGDDKKVEVGLNWRYYEFIDLANDPEFCVEQFTGLSDKNGVEIYEGDILDTTNPIFDKAKVLWEVAWGLLEDANMWGWTAKEGKTIYALDQSIQAGVVIGNIHENPELLK